MHWRDDDAFEAEMRSALALNPDELAFLASLELAARWRPATAAATRRVAWLTAAFVASAIGTWLIVAPLLAPVFELVARLGLGALLLRLGLNVVWAGGEMLVALSTSPAVAYSLPTLAVLGLALLAWPRSWASAHT